jgi:DNA-binding transcriptional ArsR family regulator
MAATRGDRPWIRLQTDDFGRAVTMLREAGMVEDMRDGQLIALRAGTGTDQVVRVLVEKGLSVYEIAREQETLEDFYLRLMNGQNDEEPPIKPKP